MVIWTHRRGGIRFIRIGRLRISLCRARAYAIAERIDSEDQFILTHSGLAYIEALPLLPAKRRA